MGFREQELADGWSGRWSVLAVDVRGQRALTENWKEFGVSSWIELLCQS